MKMLEKIKAWVKKHYPTVKIVAAEAWNSSKKAAKVAAPYLKEAGKFLWEIVFYIIEKIIENIQPPLPRIIEQPPVMSADYSEYAALLTDAVNKVAHIIDCKKIDKIDHIYCLPYMEQKSGFYYYVYEIPYYMPEDAATIERILQHAIDEVANRSGLTNIVIQVEINKALRCIHVNLTRCESRDYFEHIRDIMRGGEKSEYSH